MHQDLLRNENNSLIQGKNIRVLARGAERLMRTELSRVRTAAQMREYDENGFEEYMCMACGDADVCDVCKKLDARCSG